ncbi:MAG: hypothetical protein JO051_09035 [Acidobacteriaceae bacterium]|nr:hypothetical protein [Acidobacteriaceae bacterium]
MKKLNYLAVCALLFTWPVAADVIYLNSGQQYYGHMLGEREAQLAFQDNQGVQYNFPIRDLKSVSFNQSGETIVLRNGRTYFGQIQGPQGETIGWVDKQGVSYQFPVYDVSNITFSDWQGPYGGGRAGLVLPAGTEISVLTNLSIDSRNAQPGQTFPAQITRDVTTSDGRVVIPRNSDATLVLRNERGGGVHEGDVVLDLDSVMINGLPQSVVTSDVVETNGPGVGANKRTGAFVGGGAVLGALLGAVAGGGKGAAIGAAAGAGAGAITEIATHGHHVYVPAETTLTFQLTSPVMLRPGGPGPGPGPGPR